MRKKITAYVRDRTAQGGCQQAECTGAGGRTACHAGGIRRERQGSPDPVAQCGCPLQVRESGSAPGGTGEEKALLWQNRFPGQKLKKDEVYYIGRSVIADNPAEPEVIDWRAPIASVYYDAALGDVSYSVKGEGKYDITLSRKRTYEIEMMS